MLKRTFLSAFAVAAVAITGSAKPHGNLRCSLTGKTISECCCEKSKTGTGLYCPLAKKDIQACCCEAAK